MLFRLDLPFFGVGKGMILYRIAMFAIVYMRIDPFL